LGLLPRQCPVCGDYTIIGHGRRLRQAHDDQHERLLVRRGVCHPCGKTFTILPELAGAFRAFQLALPATSLRIDRRGSLRRASRTALQRSVALSRSIHDPSMGPTSTAQRVLLGESRSCWLAPSTGTHHRRLGSQRSLPYSVDRGKQSVNRQALDELKQQIPLMGYLQAHDWSPAQPLRGGRWMGLGPLHEDRKPSFLVDTNKDLFYCYGCGRGGGRDSFR
jgi:hypothetical protein